MQCVGENIHCCTFTFCVLYHIYSGFDYSVCFRHCIIGYFVPDILR